jgi:hypothetical protein
LKDEAYKRRLAYDDSNNDDNEEQEDEDENNDDKIAKDKNKANVASNCSIYLSYILTDFSMRAQTFMFFIEIII